MLVLPARSRLHPLRSASCLCQSPPQHSTVQGQLRAQYTAYCATSAQYAHATAYNSFYYLGEGHTAIAYQRPTTATAQPAYSFP